MSHTLKIWEKVLEKKIGEEVSIAAEKFGFMPGRVTTDAIFALRKLIGKYKEGQKDLHLMVMDLEKAYDRVPRQEI